MLRFDARRNFRRVSCDRWAEPYHKVFGFVSWGEDCQADGEYLVKLGLFLFPHTIDEVNSHGFPQGSQRLVLGFVNYPSCT